MSTQSLQKRHSSQLSGHPGQTRSPMNTSPSTPTHTVTRMRAVGPGDRALIYNTIARLQAAGLAYRGCRANQFLILDYSTPNPNPNPKNNPNTLNSNSSAVSQLHPKVYPTNPAGIVQGLSRDELDVRAEEWHWDALERLFAELEMQVVENLSVEGQRIQTPSAHIPTSGRYIPGVEVPRSLLWDGAFEWQEQEKEVHSQRRRRYMIEGIMKPAE